MRVNRPPVAISMKQGRKWGKNGSKPGEKKIAGGQNCVDNLRNML